MLETFHQRLRDLCADHITCAPGDRTGFSQDQAQHACTLARELGILKIPGLTWTEFRHASEDLHFGTEHAVEFADKHARVLKITIPPGFGLIPCLKQLRTVNLRNDPTLPAFRTSLEFDAATPLEYLDRWIVANEAFRDDAKLASVISWADGQVSFVITQPQYHGVPASPRQIEQFFTSSGWVQLAEVSTHTLYYHYAFQTLAIDALSRNCYVHEGSLLPFDVILFRPDEGLERFLKLYPE